MTVTGLDKIYDLVDRDDAKSLYGAWAQDYDRELSGNGYVTPDRCAAALASCTADLAGPVADFGCGTGLSGEALARAGFTCVDGYDLSSEMLTEAGKKAVYRSLDTLDLSGPMDHLPGDAYAGVAAIGVLNAAFMPPETIDAMLGLLPSGGHMVCSLNDRQLADGRMETRILELTEYNVADLVFKEHGPHLPGRGLQSTVYVLRTP
ncbi:MAG: class I SAM-dependent methyltransferase [Pseudomonadota bacterium]